MTELISCFAIVNKEKISFNSKSICDSLNIFKGNTSMKTFDCTNIGSV